MNSKIIIIIVVLIIILGGTGYLLCQPKAEESPAGEVVVDPKNATFLIGGEEVALVNGIAEKEVGPGGASKLITRYFGNEAKADLNGDGVNDVVFLLTQNSGGTGTFYYVTAALSSKYGSKGTNAIFLGDRISPQTTEIRNGEIVVNYADRRPDEPMAAVPSVGVSKYFIIKDNGLAEVQK